MADTGFVFSTFALTDGQGDFSWLLATNVRADDGQVSTGTLTSTNQFSDNLKCQTWSGFSSIPVGATLDGIEVRMESWRWLTTAGMGWQNAKLIDENDASPGLSRHLDLSAITNSAQTETIGSPTDLWGLTPAPLDVQDIDWGFLFNTFAVDSGDDMEIDSIAMKVYYSEAGPLITEVNSGADEWADGSTGNVITGVNLT